MNEKKITDEEWKKLEEQMEFLDKFDENKKKKPVTENDINDLLALRKTIDETIGPKETTKKASKKAKKKWKQPDVNF